MKKVIVFAFLLVATFTANAQLKHVVADKIIATVGDKIILKSDIDNKIFDIKRNNSAEELPDNLDCLLLEQAIALKALVSQAEKDSIPASDDAVEADLDKQVQYFINVYGSKEMMERVVGKTVFQIKEEFRPAFKEKRLAEGEREKIWGNIRITPEEVQAYYNKIPKDSLHFYESEIEVGQIVIFPKPSRDVEAYMMDQLKEYKEQAENGTKSFESLAKLYSDDPGTKENGGLIEINRNEKTIDPTFLAKAFALKNGQISGVFKSKFGYHIIKMESKRGDDATVRHILKIPQVSSYEINQAKELLDSVRTLLVEGKMTFGEAVDKYSEDENNKFTGGLIANNEFSTSLTYDDLDKDILFMMDTLKVGQFSAPVEFADYRGKRGVRIIYLISKTEPHRENLKDDYDKVAARALEEKKNEALEKWFTERVTDFYIKIDPDYLKCSELKKWTGSAVTGASKK
ncbi:MAG: peptidylprolyl isomerase [Chitinophagaceae bacterium]|nr:peptidylprolyl isomerase [Chitinophagaceae bacterium]